MTGIGRMDTFMPQKEDPVVVSFGVWCGLTMRCTRHLTQPAFGCRYRRSASIAGERRSQAWMQ